MTRPATKKERDAYWARTPGEDWRRPRKVYLTGKRRAKMSKTEFRLTMADLFSVWKGTPNAEQILEDVCFTFAHRAFKLERNESLAFVRACRGYRK